MEQTTVISVSSPEATSLLRYESEISARLEEYSSIGGALPTNLRSIQTILPGLAATIKQADINAYSCSTSSKDKATTLNLIAACEKDVEELCGIIEKILPHHSHPLLKSAILAIYGSLNDRKLGKHRARLEDHVTLLTPYAACHSFKTSLALLEHWEEDGTEWSGTGQRYDVDYQDLDPAFQAQLDKANFMAKGGFGVVYKALYRGVLLARKQIYVDPNLDKSRLKLLRAEPDIGQKLDRHHHIIKLVGTYKGLQGDNINILTFPVAVCDLGRFLDDCEKWQHPTRSLLLPEGSRLIAAHFQALGLDPTTDLRPQIAPMLRHSMGCITQALKWMHSNQISHRDLKPANILLRRGELFITDFGISRDRSQMENSTTEFHVGHSQAYAAPEVRSLERYNARQADIYSLGCIFLYILTVLHAPNSTFPRHKERHSERRDAFVDYLAEAPRRPHQYIPADLVSFLEPMFAERNRRPRAKDVDRSLQNLGGPDGIYHGPCCPYRIQFQRWSRSDSTLESPP